MKMRGESGGQKTWGKRVSYLLVMSSTEIDIQAYETHLISQKTPNWIIPTKKKSVTLTNSQIQQGISQKSNGEHAPSFWDRKLLKKPRILTFLRRRDKLHNFILSLPTVAKCWEGNLFFCSRPVDHEPKRKFYIETLLSRKIYASALVFMTRLNAMCSFLSAFHEKLTFDVQPYLNILRLLGIGFMKCHAAQCSPVQIFGIDNIKQRSRHPRSVIINFRGVRLFAPNKQLFIIWKKEAINSN